MEDWACFYCFLLGAEACQGNEYGQHVYSSAACARTYLTPVAALAKDHPLSIKNPPKRVAEDELCGAKCPLCGTSAAPGWNFSNGNGPFFMQPLVLLCFLTLQFVAERTPCSRTSYESLCFIRCTPACIPCVYNAPVLYPLHLS
ncbi:unnamed protein product [Symbiodinium natans]|uniref:Uncharacterized protein n=1 Tax=Symbiodinium natans TaxID=878477 RepID=A0A812KC27_9DINO|nr:unnamed protein product [Symbiodinium natans]